ncbi:DUF2637 domain-containing protein [Streptomyces sp. NPDC060011]|uniref:DUF2637 domain-containing protein n=1 Tax=Streptomyces sp. NPDC060011 TaxID=3347037 RepID=UPI0036C1A262
MHNERNGQYPGFYTPDYPYAYGNDALREPGEAPCVSSSPLDSGWDPAEELAFLLHDAIEGEQPRIPPARMGEPSGPDPSLHQEALVQLTAELPPLRTVTRGHRKVRKQRPDKIRVASYCFAAAASAVASTISVFGGVVAYDPLRFIASGHTEHSAVPLWPMLIFGPSLVGSLAILRAALHQRRALHSWCVVLLFSSIAMALCVAQAPNGFLDRATAALPSFASLTCFQQLVRQITLTRPPRRATPRHRPQTGGKANAETPRG